MNGERLEIPIKSSDIALEELRQLLIGAFSESSDRISLDLRQIPSIRRSPVSESTVIVAVLTGGAATLSALVTGLLKVVERRQDRSGKIVFKGANGRTLEVPAGTPSDRLAELIELAKALDEPIINLKL